MTKLITIPFSHYCEKARWALDVCGVAYHEDGHLPMFHYLPVKLAGASRTVPVLVTDDKQVIADSTDIVAWADARRPGTLIPVDETARADARHLEEDLDRHLGPATRRWGYAQVLPRKDLLDRMLVHGVPRREYLAMRVVRPLAVRLISKGLRIDVAGVERSRAKIDETFSLVSQLLEDGRRYLIGDRFSVADLAFAAFAAPVVLPPEYPAKLPMLEDFQVRRASEWRRGGCRARASTRCGCTRPSAGPVSATQRELRRCGAQRQHRDLGVRTLARPARDAREPDPRRDVELRAGELEHAAAKRDPCASQDPVGDPLDVDLATVRVARQHEIRAALRDVGTAVGRMTQHEAGHLRGHAGERDIEIVMASHRVVDPDHREWRAADVGDRRLVTQHLVAVALERGPHTGAPHEVVVVAEHREHARGAQPRELVVRELDLAALPAHVIAGQHDQIRGRSVRAIDRRSHVRCGSQVADMNVRELRDAHAVVTRVESRDPHLVLGDTRRDDGCHPRTVRRWPLVGNCASSTRPAWNALHHRCLPGSMC